MIMNERPKEKKNGKTVGRVKKARKMSMIEFAWISRKGFGTTRFPFTLFV